MGMTRNTLKDLWQNIKKREREVEEEDSETLEDKDIILEIDRETLLQEYIPKANYEARLRADMAAMLEDIFKDFEKAEPWDSAITMIQDRINALRGGF